MSGKNGARPATAVEFAIAVVASRSTPEKKLRERLTARYDAVEVEAALARLRELRLVDDTAWAERFARDRFERVGKGRHRIRNELLAHGIDAATAEASIALVLGGEVEREKAAAVLETMRSRLSRGVSGPANTDESPAHGDGSPAVGAAGARRASESLKNRLFRRMLARGYPACLVRDLLDVS